MVCTWMFNTALILVARMFKDMQTIVIKENLLSNKTAHTTWISLDFWGEWKKTWKVDIVYEPTHTELQKMRTNLQWKRGNPGLYIQGARK